MIAAVYARILTATLGCLLTLATVMRFRCLPDTVDPRGPKGGTR
jgi:hypothetical protein